jgi:outer membrane protein TolC
MRLSFFILLLFLSNKTIASESYSLSELEKLAEMKSFEVQELRSAASAARLSAYARLGDFSPEIGAEGNWRYNQESEKLRDLSYYAYGKWNVFRGFSDFKRWSAAQDLNRTAQIKADRVVREVHLTLRKAYIDVHLTQSLIELTQEHFQLSESQIQMARKKISGGLATEADLYDFNIHQTALKSDKELQQIELAEKWQNLEQIVGQALDRTRSLSTPEPLEIPDSPTEDWVTSALSTSDTMLNAQIAESHASADKWGAFGQLMPTADLEVKYGKLFESDFGESRKDSWAIVGTVSIPIFDGFKRLNEARAKSYDLDQARVESRRAQLQVTNSTNLLVQKVQSLTTRIALEENRLKQSQKYYEITLSEYRRGVKNSPDLASASDRLFDTKQAVIQLRRDLDSAKVDLLIATGSR